MHRLSNCSGFWRQRAEAVPAHLRPTATCERTPPRYTSSLLPPRLNEGTEPDLHEALAGEVTASRLPLREPCDARARALPLLVYY